MSNLRTLKNKISTIKSIKKIFSVMQLIASSKMKKAQEEVQSSNRTIEKIKTIFLSALEGMDPMQAVSSLNLAPVNPQAPVLYLLLSSDRGLCGNYNALVARKLQEMTKNDGNFLLGFVGKKVKSMLAAKYQHDKILPEISYSFNEVFASSEKINLILDQIFNMFSEGKISDCQIIYVFAKNAISKEVKMQSLFDFKMLEYLCNCDPKSNKIASLSQEDEIDLDSKKIFEPGQLQVLQIAKDFYFRAKFFNFFRNAYFAEVASRMVAMDNAGKNSSEIQKNLTLSYNKKRQENITRDLIDIINGAENI